MAVEGKLQDLLQQMHSNTLLWHWEEMLWQDLQLDAIPKSTRVEDIMVSASGSSSSGFQPP